MDGTWADTPAVRDGSLVDLNSRVEALEKTVAMLCAVIIEAEKDGKL